MIAAIWCSFVIGPTGMAVLYHSAVGRRHPRLWRWSAGAGMAVLAAIAVLSLASISIADRGLAGAALLLGYLAVCAGLLSASSSKKEWISSVSLISYLALGWMSFVIAVPGFLIFGFFASDLVEPYFFQDLGRGLSCEAEGGGGTHDLTKISLHQKLAYLPFLRRALDSRLDMAVTANPENSCREMRAALAARRAGVGEAD